MKLASLNHARDGQLIVVDSSLQHYVLATHITPTMQSALDNWQIVEPQLNDLAKQLEAGTAKSLPFEPGKCASPLPRSYHWADGSAYVNHVELVRKARSAEMPETYWTDPLMYQGGSDTFLGPMEDIAMVDEAWGIDFEAEVAVVVDDVPMGINQQDALQHIKLVMLVNDVSLRNLIPGELAKGFGFYQAKPSSAFSPVAVTPQALGDAWDGSKLHLPLRAILNDKLIGQPNAGIDMTFDFGQLIAHAAKTRALCAGTIIGSGTVSNLDRSQGSCCLAEVRMLEVIAKGQATTDFMHFGDRIQIEMLDSTQQTIFGQIDQQVVAYHEPL
ncbi:MAG: fumarylacetoacetate hydrolase family protein [Porticoccaceae bacterium]|nr:fumarylacetoacetate hydrolase family protein [Porticoccaceae bacterium]|tara:strand:- start:637 stop:1623 length:987 start_codon:yes stop_codon:yes gene_type:complete